MQFFTKGLMVLGIVLVAAPKAQDLAETISELTGAAAEEYVAPVVSGFGSNLNAGWYHKAPAPKKFGIHFEGGLVGMATSLGSGSEALNVTGSFRLDSAQSREIADKFAQGDNSPQAQALRDSLTRKIWSQENEVQFEGPTIIGSDEDNMRIVFAERDISINTQGGDTTVTVPGDTIEIEEVTGLLGDLSALPLVTPQITVGTIFGTNLTLRYLPETETIDEIGAINFFGFGIQHNPSVWLGTTLPVDLSVGYFTQRLEVGTLFEATSNAYGLNVSKEFGWRFLNLTPYGGFMYESSTMDFAYTYTYEDPATGAAQEEEIEFSLDGENSFRATGGLSIRLLAINLNADYNFAKYPSFSFGVMVGI